MSCPSQTEGTAHADERFEGCCASDAAARIAPELRTCDCADRGVEAVFTHRPPKPHHRHGCGKKQAE